MVIVSVNSPAGKHVDVMTTLPSKVPLAGVDSSDSLTADLSDCSDFDDDGRSECRTFPQHLEEVEDITRSPTCDACPRCDDVCMDFQNCVACLQKLEQETLKNETHEKNKESGVCSFGKAAQRHQPQQYTMCQVRRHNHMESAWIVVGTKIYDVTSYFSQHPGGTQSLLRRAGGQTDCSEDWHFHSKVAQKQWKRHFIGTVKKCGENCGDEGCVIS